MISGVLISYVRWVLPSGPGSGPETSSRGLPLEAASGLRQVAGRPPDLAVLDRGAPDHAGQDPERAGREVAHALEPHPHRADERVALLLGVLPGQRGQLDAQAVGVDVEPRVVVLGDLDDEVVRDQGPALGDDRRPVVHLPLNRAGYLDRLKLGLERPRKGTFDHPLEPVLKALQDSHRGALLSLPYPIVSAMWDSLRTC